jgi:RNA polymerase sigma factor (sigma-70 family)
VKREHFKVTLAPEIVAPEDQVDADALEIALRRLAQINQDHARIVEMRYFGGMTVEEIAEATGKSVSTIKRGWRVSRAWLYEALL